MRQPLQGDQVAVDFDLARIWEARGKRERAIERYARVLGRDQMLDRRRQRREAAVAP